MSTTPQIQSIGRIPALDGWRGLAIALVLFDHIQDSLLGRYAASSTQTGQHGVTIFFVLSGFLITSKLLDGPINLQRFYIRRFFRLMPAAWTYLAFLFLLRILCNSQKIISLKEISSCVFFYRNFVDLPGLTGHFWSLSLEEQFYLIWPCLLLLAGKRSCRWIALAGALVCAGIRMSFWTKYDHNVLNGQSQVRADALLIGCLLALLLSDHKIRSAIARWSARFVIPSLLVLAFCVSFFRWLPPLTECVAIASLIAASVLHPKSAMGRAFALAPLAWLGSVSYSIYIWQEIFMPFHSSVVLILGIPCFALGSYYFIERPLVRLGHRLSMRAVLH